MRIVALVLLLSTCSNGGSPPPPPVETFEQMLLRTEGVTCADVTYHDYWPVPDCRKINAAWDAGRKRVVLVYPEAAQIQMSAVTFYRPKLTHRPDRPYPLIADVPGNPRGLTYMEGGILITYAHEEIIEHETVHALTYLLDGMKVREPAAIQQDMGGYFASDFLYRPFSWYLIACHGTPDDPFGEAGNRTSCTQPFSGPLDWRDQILAMTRDSGVAALDGR